MQILDKIPPLAPQILMRAPRGMWLLTAVLIALFLALQMTGLFIPIPFLLLLVTVAVSGAIAGTVSGTVSGLLMSGFIIYSWSIGSGPEPLTGNLFRALLGCAVSTMLGAYLGVIRDQLVSSYTELQNLKTELTLLGDQLATRVRRQTRYLEATGGELRAQQNQLEKITKHWIDTQEIERRNLARDLHDDVGQTLTALRINLDSGRRAADPESSAAGLLGKSTALVDTAIDSIRQLSLSLRPPVLDDLGLSAAIREHVSRLLRPACIEFELHDEGDDSIIDGENAIAAFRISQEAISNVLRHSEARHVRILVQTRDDSLCVEIRDDGKGFELGTEKNLADHFGLASMRERAALAGGKATIESAPGAGTNVRVRLPILPQAPAA